MADVDVIDEIAIRLVADGTAALDEADRVIDELEEKGREAARVYGKGFNTELAMEAAVALTMIAEQTKASFEDVAKSFADEPFVFGRFETDELVMFANALEEMGGLEAWDQLHGHVDTLYAAFEDFLAILNREVSPATEEFADVVTGEAAPATQELSKYFIELADYGKSLGLVLDAKTSKSLKEMTDAMDALEAEGGDVSAQLEKMKADMREQASDMLMVERQVWKVIDAYREMGIAIPDALQRDKIRQHVRQLQKYADRFSDVKAEADRFTDALINQGKQAKASEGILGKLGGVAQGLGFSLGGMVTGLSAAAVAFKILKGAINEVQEATRFALAFTDTTRDLAAAIRVNSIAGKENTMVYAEWQRVADEIAEVTSTNLVASYESVSMALRDLGAGTELHDGQIQDLVLTGARWAEIYGETLPSGLKKLTQFINTGYGMALKQLGFQLDKVAQDQKAMELGLGTNINKLSESQQEMVRYALLMDELEKRTEGVAIQTGTFADRLDKVDKRAEIAKKTLGDMFVPIAVKLKEFWVNVKTGFAGLIGWIALGIQNIVAEVVGHLLGIAATVKFVLDNIGKEGFWEKMEGLPELFKEAKEQATFEILRYQVEQMTGAVDELETAAEGATGAIGDMGDEVGTTAKQLGAFIKEARKFDEGMAKITRKLNQAILDIEEQFSQRRSKSEVNLQRKLRDIDYDASVDRLEALRDFEIDEIRMREDHQKDIYQLEERFLLDLEDAVRNRDARQVLQLQRRFSLEKKNREEDFNMRTKRRKEDLSFELQDIAFARAMRRQDRILAFNEEMDDLAAQERLRKEQVRLRAKRQEDDLLEQIKNRLLALTESAEGELAIEKELLDALVEALIDTYGDDGPWVQWHEVAVDVTENAARGIANANEQIVSNLVQTERAITQHLRNVYDAAVMAERFASSFGSYFESEGGKTPYSTEPGPVLDVIGTTEEQVAEYFADLRAALDEGKYRAAMSRRQRGGTVFATSPTGFIAGEGGRPERVDITPFSQSTGKPSAGFRTAGDKITIDLNVEASEMLKVEVADHTMGEIADVYVNITQRGFQGGRGA